MTHREKFTQALDAALRELLRASPREYNYSEQDVPEKAASMVRMLITGHTVLGPAVRKAAKDCGVKPTTAATIRKYLKG